MFSQTDDAAEIALEDERRRREFNEWLARQKAPYARSRRRYGLWAFWLLLIGGTISYPAWLVLPLTLVIFAWPIVVPIAVYAIAVYCFADLTTDMMAEKLRRNR